MTTLWHPTAYAGDVVDTGSSRKSATNSVLWIFRDDIPALSNKRAGGRIPLIIGHGLTEKAREALNLGATELLRKPEQPADSDKGFSLAQKMVGKTRGLQ